MKKIYTLLAIAVIGITSCKKQSFTTNNNYTWTQIARAPLSNSSQPYELCTSEFFFFYSDGSNLYTSQYDDYSGFRGSYSSSDNGKTWTKILGFSDAMIRSGNNLIVNDIENNGAGIISGGTYNQASALCSPPFVNGGCLKVNDFTNLNNSTVLAATDRGVIKTSDNGLTWAQSNTGLPSLLNGFKTSISKILSVGQYVFAATSYNYSGYNPAGVNTVFKSSDNGNTWTEVNAGLGTIASSGKLNKIVASGNLVYLLYTLSNNVLVFKTSNYGISWSQLNFSFPNNEQLVSIASNNTDLYALTDGQSVYKSTDNGNNWVKISPDDIRYGGLGQQRVFNDIIVTSGKLYIKGYSTLGGDDIGVAYYTSI